MRIAIVVQARMNSSRLPGKMLKNAQGRPVIWYVLSSLAQCSEVDIVILSTSDLESDIPLAEYAEAQGYSVFRGALDDVSGRYLATIEEFKLDAFVRICGDSPLVDHRIVEEAVRIYKSGDYDIVSNVIKRTYPKGQSVEVVSATMYKKLAAAGMDLHDREHVTPIIYRNLSKLSSYSMESGADAGAVQLSVDTPEDFSSFETMLSKMDKEHFKYTWQEKMDLL